MKKLTAIGFIFAIIAVSTSACNSTPAKSDGSAAKSTSSSSGSMNY